MSDRRIRLAAALAVVFLLGSFAPRAEEPEIFPEPETIRENVDFWIRVFSEWTLGQAAVHDLDYPGLIYEVVDLPGPIADRYSDDQLDFLEQVREGWADYLEYLEQMVAGEEELSELGREWVAHIGSVVGPEALVGAHERIRTQRGLRERFRAGLERSARYDAVIRGIFREAGLPEELTYMPHVESSFQYHARSSAGATGLWQFTRGTGRRYMTINSTIDERLDPIAATRAAAGYLGEAYEKLGSWPLALTSYNHGVQGMLKAKERHGSDFSVIYREYEGKLFGFASKNFYAEYLAARAIAENAEAYFPEGFEPEPPFDLDSVVLERRAGAKSVAHAYGVELDELAELNPAWSQKAIQRGSALPSGTRVWLPAGTLAELAAAGGAPPEPGLDTGRTYVVRSGDTLSTIASRHGVSVRQLRELNEIPSGSSLIRDGQTLVIESGDPEVIHVVERGETLSEIAVAYGVKPGEVREINEISSHASIIRVGQKLRLPPGASYRESSRRHVVRRGDTLLTIASRYGIRISDLLRVNTLSMDTVIHPGQSLRIP